MRKDIAVVDDSAPLADQDNKVWDRQYTAWGLWLFWWSDSLHDVTTSDTGSLHLVSDQ